MTKISFQRNLAFLFILTLGILYISFLSLAFLKIFSGFSMQLIFLIDALKNNHQNLIPLIISSTFYINVLSGIILFILLLRFFKSLDYSFNKIFLTKKFLNNLKSKRQNQYNLIKIKEVIAFTSGFLNPQIYISEKLIKTVNPKELEAIIFHEQKHQFNFDPLKDFIVDLINHFLPSFPKKVWIFKNYSALVEINCDNYAQTQLKSKTPLVSALLKIEEPDTRNNFYLNNFSEFHERVSVLVDKKKPNFKNFFTLNSFLLVLILFTTTFIGKSTIFYQCNHLVKCVEVLFSHQNISLSDHCKE